MSWSRSSTTPNTTSSATTSLKSCWRKGSGWLANHPEREEITRRYLKFQPSLFRQALARLVQDEQPSETEDDEQSACDTCLKRCWRSP